MSNVDDNEPQDELDQLAAEYVLGTLAAGPRTEFEHHMNHDDELKALVDSWEQKLKDPPEPAPVQLPPSGLWPRMKRWLHHGR
ncbi:hypothetical protein N5D52_23645 [Pseudomonas sp. GD03860]|uniref:hypothetical protein n=1 Tax=Pseudomonas TaxID=286 RepID=UPI002364326C|nr:MULTISPECIES: hypothetical protein [Pseudomonas]MDD2058863.1 hypothetical protein [Pseudomonas putida]MDH0639923.1 hypothetical protein [Pseudomonas sp. GD03860]